MPTICLHASEAVEADANCLFNVAVEPHTFLLLEQYLSSMLFSDNMGFIVGAACFC
jgi:hypothetical protein